MEWEDTWNTKVRFSLPTPSSSDLRGRQSVRATFKLSEKAINAINVVAKHLGIKQKSLFDHLIADYGSLDLIASEIEPGIFERLDRVQKTYVISRKTLSCLGEVSKKFDAPRDALVEYSVLRLLPIIAEERERHKKRKEILEELNSFLRQGEEILKKCRKKLTEEDPVYGKMEGALNVCRNAVENIRAFVERGNVIEDFEKENVDGSTLVGHG